MKKNRKIIVGNWKMNPGSLDEAKDIFSKVSRKMSKTKNVQMIVCPPFVYLPIFSSKTSKNLFLGSQNVFWQNEGKFTGEISPKMIKGLGIEYTIVGHSERRARGETDEAVAEKVNSAIKQGLKVILCVGESSRDAGGAYFEFLRNQIVKSLSLTPKKNIENVLIAYEPVWAVGKSWKEAMNANDIRETAIFIRKVLSDIYDQKAVSDVPILYGGSVEVENSAGIFKDAGVEGVLVGHKSLIFPDFIEIIKNADEI
jgi:triosephosphate isomerase